MTFPLIHEQHGHQIPVDVNMSIPPPESVTRMTRTIHPASKFKTRVCSNVLPPSAPHLSIHLPFPLPHISKFLNHILHTGHRRQHWGSHGDLRCRDGTSRFTRSLNGISVHLLETPSLTDTCGSSTTSSAPSIAPSTFSYALIYPF
jgi:hypothetical protein